MADPVNGLKLFFTNNPPSGYAFGLGGIVQTLGEGPITGTGNAVITSGGGFDNSNLGTTDTVQIYPSGTNANALGGFEISQSGQNFPSGWLYDADLTNKVLEAGEWQLTLMQRSHITTAVNQRMMINVGVVTPTSGGIFNTDFVKFLTKPAVEGIASFPSSNANLFTWQSATISDRIPAVAGSASGSFLVPTTTEGFSHITHIFPISGYTFASGERLFVQIGCCDATNATARIPVLQYHHPSSFLITPTIYNTSADVPYATTRYYFTSQTLGAEYNSNNRQLTTFSGISGVDPTTSLRGGRFTATAPANIEAGQFVPGSSLSATATAIILDDSVGTSGGGWIVPSGILTGVIPSGSPIIAGFRFGSNDSAQTKLWSPFLRLRTVRASGNTFAPQVNAFDTRHSMLTVANTTGSGEMSTKVGWKDSSLQHTYAAAAASGIYEYYGVWETDRDVNIQSADVLMVEVGFGGPNTAGTGNFSLFLNSETNFIDLPLSAPQTSGLLGILGSGFFPLEETNLGTWQSGLTPSENVGIFESGVSQEVSYLGIFISGIPIPITSGFVGMMQSGIVAATSGFIGVLSSGFIGLSYQEFDANVNLIGLSQTEFDSLLKIQSTAVVTEFDAQVRVLEQSIPPSATITYLSPTGFAAASLVTGSGEGTAYQSKSITSYKWFWGDSLSSVSGTQNSTHNYTSSGLFTVILQVIDSEGLIGQTSAQINSASGLILQTADISGSPRGGFAPLDVTFTSTVVPVSGTTILSYLWQFGDLHSSVLQNPSHTYKVPGNFIPILTISDSRGVRVSDSLYIGINN